MLWKERERKMCRIRVTRMENLRLMIKVRKRDRMGNERIRELIAVLTIKEWMK